MNVLYYLAIRVIPPRRGMALVLILAGLLFLGITLGGLAYFSSNERSILDHMVAQKTLVYLARAGLGIAEAKLLEGRFYAPQSEGTYEFDSANGLGHVRIYFDDFVRKKPKKVGSEEIQLLDHIKVTVIATYRRERIYGFGKFVISPEPKYDAGGSTMGVNPIHPKAKSGQFQETTTLRKLINLKILTPDEVEGIPGFSSIDLFDSRKAVAQYLKEDQLQYAANYARNRALVANLRANPLAATGTWSVPEFRAALKGRDTYSGPVLKADSESETWFLKNTFLAEVLKHFFLSTDWDLAPEAKKQRLGNILVALGSLPVKTTDGEVRQAISIAIPGHPVDVVEGVDFIATFTPQGPKTAVELFLAQRGFSQIPRDLPPVAFAGRLSEVQTSNQYKFAWQGDVLITYIGTGTPTMPSGPTVETGGAGKFIIFHNNKGQIYKVENDYEYRITNCNVMGVSGPNAGFSGYYLVDRASGQRMPLFTVLNFFLKFIDETTDTDPIEIHNWDSWADTLKIKIDEKTEQEKSWGEVSGVF